MKAGKVTQTVYRRSVLKQLHKDQTISMLSPSQEESCCGIHCENGEQVLVSQVSLFGNEKDLCIFAMAKAVNDLAAKGAKIRGVNIQVLLPDFAFESRVKAMLSLAREAAEKEGFVLLSANAQIVPAIQTTIVQVSAFGTMEAGPVMQCHMAGPGQDIVQLKWIGAEGALRIKREKEEELKERFIPVFLNKVEAGKEQLFSCKDMEKAAGAGNVVMHQIGEGGILAALWELAESAGVGLEIDMRKIAVKQETIEVCEFFHLNPYQLTSVGSVLIVTERGEELADMLNENGSAAVVIGRTTGGNERVLLSGGEKRFMERPAQDEFVRFFSEECVKK